METGEVQADISWIKRTPNYIAIEATLDKPAFIIFSQSRYLDWRVWVDGKEEVLYPAYGILSGLPLQEGMHMLEFAYKPTTLYWGLGVSFIAFILAVFIINTNRSI